MPERGARNAPLGGSRPRSGRGAKPTQSGPGPPGAPSGGGRAGGGRGEAQTTTEPQGPRSRAQRRGAGRDPSGEPPGRAGARRRAPPAPQAQPCEEAKPRPGPPITEPRTAGGAPKPKPQRGEGPQRGRAGAAAQANRSGPGAAQARRPRRGRSGRTSAATTKRTDEHEPNPEGGEASRRRGIPAARRSRGPDPRGEAGGAA